MANLQKRLDVTELDFDSIKSNLITYFKSTEPFKDWDYTGSGLNQLLDVLAYNTHYNAMLAHTAVNESFIDTAQLRTSVVSNAKLLGYIPRSKSSPTINVEMQFGIDAAGQRPTFIDLPKGSNFKTNYNNDSYVYTTLDSYRFELNNLENPVLATQYVASNDNKVITLREGSIRINRFPITNASDKTVYIIDDDNIDISTLIVRVYDNKNSLTFEQYRNFTSIQLTSETFLADAALYFLSENLNGKYQINFSNNNIFGKKPPNLGIIEIEYLTTTGSLSNGASSFRFIGTTPTGASGSLVVPKNTFLNGAVVPEKSFGGNEKESIDSIRLNAPTAFVAQNRAVTSDDYKSLIYSNFPNAKSIAVWGGESNIPVQYGNVFISIQPQQIEDSTSTEQVLTDAEKQNVLTFLDSKKILSITPVLVDAQKITLVLDVLFKYNNNLGILSTNQLQNKVFNVINTFNRDNLDSFEKVFRHSTLLRAIDTSDASILNSLVRVFVSKTFKVQSEGEQLSVPQRIILDFGTPLTVIDGRTIAYNDSWLLRGYQVYLGDEASNVQGIRNVFRYTLEAGQISKFKDNNGVIVPPIGTIDLEKGILSIEGLIGDAGQELLTFNIDVIPESNDIAPKRNQLLTIDVDRLSIIGDIDTIATGGSTRLIDYKPFSRER